MENRGAVRRLRRVTLYTTLTSVSAPLRVTAASTTLDTGVADALGTGTGVGYLMVFLLAAVPWIEVFFVVPVSIGLGMNPVAVAVLAFFGNVFPVFVIIAARGRLGDWWTQRRGEGESSRRTKRARRLFDRYGTPGLGLSAPMTTGVHLGAVVAVFLGARDRSVVVWMTLGVALWTVVFTVGSVVGFSFLGSLF